MGGVGNCKSLEPTAPLQDCIPPAPVLSALTSVPELVWATYPQTRPQWASYSRLL